MHKFLIAVVAMVAMAFNCRAENCREIQLSNDGAKLFVYLPAHPNGMAVMACPGGGYSHLAINHEGKDLAPWFNARGITYAVLQYRMPEAGSEPRPMIDAKEGLDVLIDSAAVWGVDPARIGIMGASAGGHLAAYTANTDPRVKFQILFYPVISMRDGVTHKGSQTNLLGKDAADDDKAKYSVEELVTASTPPAFIMLSSDDKTVVPENSARYLSRMFEAGVRGNEMHVYPKGGHGWGFRDSFIYKPQWTAALSDWLKLR